ncbi:ABC transporter substrate-binding protein [Lacrimispora indolis]|uniref:ABC transporter substrate-binding protein n=2 Tax=Lacrimispora indolis TaxID=69825 RepID=UPI00045E63EA|nr:ABC transporter substrate-binding protein [Lacrimispora indolis]MBE7722539.1 ABC transporter substrate-binding protein [Lacrimispora celerecrescens]
MKMSKVLAIMLAASMTFSLAACGGGAVSNSGGTALQAQNSDASSSGNSSADGSSTDSGGKDTVIVACAAEPDCFFPFHSSLKTNMDEVPILHNVYETPIKFGPDGSHEPLLAESWEVSDDGKTYTLHIRDDVYFHDGTKMTADDVAFSIDTAGHTAQGAAQLANLDSAVATDDKTVVITLTAPYGPFLNALAGRYALVVSKALYESVGEDAYNDKPVGTGPYTFVSRVSGDRITMEAFDNYWGGVPAIKHVTYLILTDINTQMVSLENGDIDVLIQANVGSLTKLKSDKVTWQTTDASSMCSMHLNLNEGPAKDINFRKALMYGINKEEVNIGVYEGYATVGDIPIAPSFSGRPDAGTYEVVEYNLDTAKEYLAKSGYNGEEFKILTVAGSRNESASQIIQGQLIELGINCTVNALDAASYQAAADAGEFGASVRAQGVSVLDADGMFFQYHSEFLVQPGLYDAGITSPEMDAYLTAGRTETDPEKRKENYAAACNLIAEHALSVCLYYEVNACAFNSSIKGVVPRALTGLYYFNDWSW